jgi:hypothetical protein
MFEPAVRDGTTVIYQLAHIAANGFLWGLLHGLLIGVALLLLALLFVRRERE